MAVFPKVHRPCPYKADLATIMEGDVCRMCKRQVHDIGAMGEEARARFLASCDSEACVTYTLSRSAALSLGAAVTAALIAAPVAAQESEPLPMCPIGPVADPGCAGISQDEEWVIVGAARIGDDAEYIDTEEDLQLPLLPVVEE